MLQIFAALDIGGNVVRTATSRLAADGWLERNRVGRNSYYRLAEKGRQTFADAAQRIYGARRPPWLGGFSMAVLASPEPDAARAKLEAAGYGTLSPGVMVAHAANAAPVPDAILLRAESDGPNARRLASLVWPTQRLAERYSEFVTAFQPLADHLGRGGTLSDIDALVSRLLLIHQYRRLILRDPMLPDALLPEAWPGNAARTLCAQLYHVLLPASERWLDENALNEDGKLPSSQMALEQRFTG